MGWGLGLGGNSGINSQSTVDGSELTLNSDSQISVDRGATESGSAGVLSSLRCCYSTECEDTGHLLPTSCGGS